MDNITHSLVGWALAETGLKQRTRKGLAACILAANMPDIDVFFGWAPWAPLAMHRGFTHGLVGGVLLMPPVLALLLWLLDRWQVRRGSRFASGLEMRPGWLVFLCYLGALTHPLLDLQNTYSVQLLSPLRESWFHTDGLFIVSPYLLAMLGLGVWLARRRSRRRLRPAGIPAFLALVGTMAFILGNVAISRSAYAALRGDGHHGGAERIFAGPQPLIFWQRELVWRQEHKMGLGFYDPLGAEGAKLSTRLSFADRMDDPVVRRAIAASDEVQDFLDWSQMPFARISRGDCMTAVTFGDARYYEGAVASGFTVVSRVPADRPSERCARP